MIVLRLTARVFSRANEQKTPPAGAGCGMVSLSEIAAAKISPFAKFCEIFSPPAWWLHGHYGVPPEQSLLLCRTVQHPLRVLRWLARRAIAGIGLSRPYEVAGILEARDIGQSGTPDHND
jgi:hypothetical protein